MNLLNFCHMCSTVLHIVIVDVVINFSRRNCRGPAPYHCQIVSGQENAQPLAELSHDLVFLPPHLVATCLPSLDRASSEVECQPPKVSVHRNGDVGKTLLVASVPILIF